MDEQLSKGIVHRTRRRRGRCGFACIPLALLLWLLVPVSSVRAQGSDTIWLRDANTLETQFTMQVGETRTIEIMVNTGSKQIVGTSFYLDLERHQFEIIDQIAGGTNEVIDPFNDIGGKFGSLQQNVIRDEHELNDKLWDFLDGGVSLGGGSFNGIGRVATFQIRALKRTTNTTVAVVESFVPWTRNSRMNELNNTQAIPFNRRTGLNITVIGVGLAGIPDVVMLPEGSDSQTDLIDFAFDFDEDTTGLSWQSFGDSPSTVDVTISSAPRFNVTYQAGPGFSGQIPIRFRVSEPNGNFGEDTVMATVSYPPEIVGMPTTITFPEDDSTRTQPLTGLVTDADGTPEAVLWEAITLDTNVIVQHLIEEDRFLLTALPNWNGFDTLRVWARDAFGAVDSLDIPIQVTLVNDAPIIDPPVPDIAVAPGGQNDELQLNDYATDVEHQVLTWSVTMASTDVTVSLDPGDGYRATFVGSAGFEGDVAAYLRVSDVQGAFALDTIQVNVSARPPKFIAGGLPDTVFCATESIDQIYVDLDNYAQDADDPIGALTWSVEQASGGFPVTIDGEQVVTVNLPSSSYRGFQYNVFTVRDPDGNTARDTVRFVVVTEGFPTVIDIPNITVPVGGVNTDLVLNNYVFNCDPAAIIDWDASEFLNVEVAIDPVTSRVTVRSPNADFMGTDVVKFRATRRDNNNMMDDRSQIQIFELGTPFVQPELPDVFLTPESNQVIELNDHLTVKPDSLWSLMQWSFTGDQANVKVELNPVTNIVTFSLQNTDFTGSQEFTFTVRNDQNGRSDSDDVIVNVSNGDPPNVGRLPDFVIPAGSSDSLYHPDEATRTLDNWVLDSDTPDASMVWTVTGNSSVVVDESRLVRNADHQLVISAIPGFIGTETLIFTVQDPEGNIDADTIEVTIVEQTAFDVAILPDPISNDYIDVVVYSTSTLRQGPTATMTLNDILYEITLMTLGGGNLWRGNVNFEISMGSGQAMIRASGLDEFNRTVMDSTAFQVGIASKTAALQLAKGAVQLTVPAGAFGQSQVVTLAGVETSLGKAAVDGFNEGDGLHMMEGVVIGPVGIALEIPAELAIDMGVLTSVHNDEGPYGLFWKSADMTAPQLLSPLQFGETTRMEIAEFGQFFIGRDVSAPIITEMTIALEPAQFTLLPSVDELGSGIQWSSASITFNGRSVPPPAVQDDGTWHWDYDALMLEGGPLEVAVQVPDRLGNMSDVFVTTVVVDATQIPKRYMLQPNYPNPFNPETAIRYQLAHDVPVILTIYDMLGRVVRTLVQEPQSAGWHTITWDGRNAQQIPVSSGVYLYRLEAGEFHHVRKMVLLK
jgi:hypothetical protein